MKSSLSSSFLVQFRSVPSGIRELARKNYKLWKQNPSHPSLHYKFVGKRTDSYSVRIGHNWRILGVKSDDTMIWFWIGTHAEYDRIIKNL